MQRSASGPDADKGARLPKVLAIVGPTSAGKSKLALRVAAAISGEIVSIDSAAVYRGMDIATDKPSTQDRAAVPHHMVDVAEPGETLSVAQFQEKARQAIDDIVRRGKTPVLVGGSGLYFRAVVDDLEFPPTDGELREGFYGLAELAGPQNLHSLLVEVDPKAAQKIPEENSRRVVRALEVVALTGAKFSDFRTGWDEYRSIYDLTAVGLTLPRPQLDRQIDERVDRYFSGGLVEEVKQLAAAGYRRSLTSVQALGYAQVLAYLDAKILIEDAVAETKRRTRRFARRQFTWFKADPRIEWFEDAAEAEAYLLKAAN